MEFSSLIAVHTLNTTLGSGGDTEDNCKSSLTKLIQQFLLHWYIAHQLSLQRSDPHKQQTSHSTQHRYVFLRQCFELLEQKHIYSYRFIYKVRILANSLPSVLNFTTHSLCLLVAEQDRNN